MCLVKSVNISLSACLFVVCVLENVNITCYFGINLERFLIGYFHGTQEVCLLKSVNITLCGCVYVEKCECDLLFG